VREFEFEQVFSKYPIFPTANQATTKGTHDFEDHRRFLGRVNLHDAWNAHTRLTLEGGGRFDATSEGSRTEATARGGEALKDEREDTDFSGDLSALLRCCRPRARTAVQAANLYASVRRAFKPAAPNLSEAEAAKILEPEHTTSWEIGPRRGVR